MAEKLLNNVTNHILSFNNSSLLRDNPIYNIIESSSSSTEMDSTEFRRRGKQMVDYIVNYLDTISQKRVTPDVEPGYLVELIPPSAPNKAEDWDLIMNDFERYIMPGVTHWKHPSFHAYYPTGGSYPSILADMLSDAIGCASFSWASCPASTELEILMVDWVAKMIGLPQEFLWYSEHKSIGGGVIQASASESVFISLIAAKYNAILHLKSVNPFVEEELLLSKLICYCSKEAHSSIEKASNICYVKLRTLNTDDDFSLRGFILAKAIEKDLCDGLLPFFVCATLGTTSCCSFDAVNEIGPICQKYGVWLHIDAAYAGSSFICPEFQYLMNGVEYSSSFSMNPHKWMLINIECSLLWVKDRNKLTQALAIDPLYLQHSYSEKAIDFRHWNIALSRRFSSLKLWFVIRNYGVEGLQKYIRQHVRLAKRFESLIRKDERFEVINKVHLGLVCFHLKGSNASSKRLLSSINSSGKIYMVPALLKDKYVIRFCVCAQHCNDYDIDYAFKVISDFANDMMDDISIESFEYKNLNIDVNNKEFDVFPVGYRMRPKGRKFSLFKIILNEVF